MNLPILEVLRDLRNKHVHLLLPPTQPSRQQRQTEALQTIKAIDLVPAAQLFHERILRPAIRGPHEHALLDVDEAGFVHLLHVQVAGV